MNLPLNAKYGERVRIVNGFYSGQEGKVIARIQTNRPCPDTHDYYHDYQVRLSDSHITDFLNEFALERIVLDATEPTDG